MLVRRFGVLCRPLEVKLDLCKEVVSACAIIHNLCIDDGIKDSSCEPNGISLAAMETFGRETWETSLEATECMLRDHTSGSQPGRRRDCETCDLRDTFAFKLACSGFTRPRTNDM